MTAILVDHPPSKKIRVVYLADHSGRLQVIFPASHMLDIAAVSRITKRRVEPIHNVNSIGDSFLKANDSNTIIDIALIKETAMSIQNHANGDYRDLTGEELKALFSGSENRFEAISVNTDLISSSANNHLDDEAQILHALGKFQSIRIKQRLEETLEIPPLPASSHRIIRLSSDQDAGTDELCDIISLDPSLAAQVMSWASSPYYGAGNIDSLEDAVIRVLGFDMVMNLALGLSMSNAFLPPDNGPHHYEDFWLNSVFHATLMEALVKVMPAYLRPKIGHAYLAGLLHNFGYLAISTIFPPHFSILSRYQEANMHLASEIIEMKVLSFTKEQLGSWLLRHWELPDNITTAIRYSKKPHYRGEHAILAKLIYVAHQLSKHMPIEPNVLEEIGLSKETVEVCSTKVHGASNELRKMATLISGKNR